MTAATPKTPRRAQIEASVLAATEELLCEGRPYSDLAIERITNRAGISRTAFYFYFRDKRELLVRLTQGVSDQLFAEADRWWSGAGSGPEQLRSALANVVGLYRDHGALLRAVVEASSSDEEIAAFWRGLVGHFIEATRARLEQEQAAGRVPAGLDADGVAFALCWMTERAIYQHVAQALPDAEPLLAGLRAAWVRTVYGE